MTANFRSIGRDTVKRLQFAKFKQVVQNIVIIKQKRVLKHRVYCAVKHIVYNRYLLSFLHIYCGQLTGISRYFTLELRDFVLFHNEQCTVGI